jgi:hypothetical protein
LLLRIGLGEPNSAHLRVLLRTSGVCARRRHANGAPGILQELGGCRHCVDGLRATLSQLASFLASSMLVAVVAMSVLARLTHVFVTLGLFVGSRRRFQGACSVAAGTPRLATV